MHLADAHGSSVGGLRDLQPLGEAPLVNRVDVVDRD
jgi:hypothetical protein